MSGTRHTAGKELKLGPPAHETLDPPHNHWVGLEEDLIPAGCGDARSPSHHLNCSFVRGPELLAQPSCAQTLSLHKGLGDSCVFF